MNDMTTQERPPEVAGYRRLERPRNDRVVAGVAAGIANHYNVGVGWVRLGFVVSSLFGGFGVLMYLLGWVGLPEEGEADSLASSKVRDVEGARSWLGLAFIVLAVVIILSESRLVSPGLLWASALVLAGVLLYRGDLPETIGRSRAGGDHRPPPDDDEPSRGGTPLDDGPPTDELPPALPDAGDDGEAGDGADGTTPTGVAAATAGIGDTVDLVPPPPPSGGDEIPPPSPPPPPVPAPRREAEPSRPRRRRSLLGRFTMATMLIVLGVMGLFHAADVIEPTARQYVAAAVVTVGLGLVVGTWWGRAHTLIFFGILLLPLLAGATLVRVPLDGGFGDPVYRPATAADVADEYRLIGGELTLDLGDIDLDAGPVAVELTNAFGSLEVIVPRDAGVTITARVGAGDLSLPGLDANGVDVERSLVLEGEGDLTLDIEVGFGEIRVLRTER